MTATLIMYKVDLNWANEQYWDTLYKVIRELNKTYNPPKKKDISSSEMQSFIK